LHIHQTLFVSNALEILRVLTLINIMGIYKTPVITEDIENSNCEMQLFINTNDFIVLKTSMSGNFDDEYGNAVICINKQTANDLIKELKILIKQMPNG
jgi:hypothetical protein